MNPILTVVVVSWVACAGFCAFIAKSKNRDQGGWFFLGLLFGIFALIALAAVPPLSSPTPEPNRPILSREQIAQAESDRKTSSFVSWVFIVLAVVIIIFLFGFKR